MEREYSISFRTLKERLINGTLKVPQFQREFVWDLKKSVALLDSLLKEYPIGAFIFWNTDKEFRSVRNIGSIEFKGKEKEKNVDYVIDGQQRITSLYAILEGETIKAKNKETDYRDVYIDLEANVEEGDDIVIRAKDKKEDSLHRYISLHILNGTHYQFLASFPSEKQDKIETYKNIISSFSIPVAKLPENTGIEVATEVFTRLNIGGQSLTLFEIMAAKVYDETENFDLKEKYDELCSQLEEENFNTIPAEVVLRVISIFIEKNCKTKTILNLEKKAFIRNWDEAIKCIKRSIDYFRSHFGIKFSQLLPYNFLIISFAYFFKKYGNKAPTGDIQRYLSDFFWRCSVGERYVIQLSIIEFIKI